jgi:hypothetical protein
MFKQSSSAAPMKKSRCVYKRDVCFTKGNIRQIIYRRYLKGNIHGVRNVICDVSFPELQCNTAVDSAFGAESLPVSSTEPYF